MMSGGVRNRTYQAWRNIKLPKYFIKLHEGCYVNKKVATWVKVGGVCNPEFLHKTQIKLSYTIKGDNP